MTDQPDRQDGDGLATKVQRLLYEGIDPVLSKDECEFVLAQIRATPQPAPDAMREALATRFETLRANYKRGWLVADTKAFEEFCFANSDQISAALSAPVPPADGAPMFQCLGCKCDISSEPHKPGCPCYPSATGAAEPVAWQWEASFSTIEDGSLPEHWINWKWQIGFHEPRIGRDIRNVRPLYAIPIQPGAKS